MWPHRDRLAPVEGHRQQGFAVAETKLPARRVLLWMSAVAFLSLGVWPALESAPDFEVSASGHYLRYRGQTLLLVGDSGTQCATQNANLDYRAWIDDCHARGIRAVHVWSFLSARQKEDGSTVEDRWGYVYPCVTPWARHTSGALANDQLPRWNLQAFDEGPDDDLTHYWPRMRDMCRYAKSKEMLIGYTVFTGWIKGNHDAWEYHPFNVENGGHLTRNLPDGVTLASPGTEVWQETWSDAWATAKKTQWIWEQLAVKAIGELGSIGNVFFVFYDEHSYDEGNMGDHFRSFFRSRGHVWMDWKNRRAGVDLVMSETFGGEDKNADAVTGFIATPPRPYFFLEGEPYMGDGVRTAIWTFATGGGHYFFHADAGQETPRTGIMGYDPNVPGGNKGMVKRDWLGHASRFFNEYLDTIDSMTPRNDLVGPAATCLADPGREYAVYSRIGAADVVSLDLTGGASTFQWRFYSPRTGSFSAAQFTFGGKTEFFPRPDEEDWVLHVARDDSSGAPVAKMEATPTSGAAPLEVQFSAADSYDEDGAIADTRWDFGDGATGGGLSVTHVYSRGGTFYSILTVRDNDGLLATTGARIEVSTEEGRLLRRITGLEPRGSGLQGSVRLRSVTAEGGFTRRDLVGVDTVRTAGSFDAGRNNGLPGVGVSQALQGLELGYAILGLNAPGERVDAYFSKAIVPDGTPAPELFVLEWSASTDDFQIHLLENGPAEPLEVADTIRVRSLDYTPTATTLDTTVGAQAIGGVALNLDSLDRPNLRIRGLRLPAEDGRGTITGLDPSVVAAAIPPPVSFLRGDADTNGELDLTDAIVILDFLFLGGRGTCWDAMDGNDDGQADVSDAISVLLWLFLDFDPLPEPFSACGPDPTEDALACSAFEAC